MKLQRDELAEENQALAEANRRYRMHTSELKDRVELLVVSNYTLFTAGTLLVDSINCM